MRIFAVILAILFFGTLATAESVFVYPAQGKGVQSTDLETITELLKSGVDQVDGFELSQSEGGSQVQLHTKVLKLGDAYIIKVDKHAGKTRRFSAKMKATDLEDMDVVAVRVVRSTLTEVAPKDTATVTDVTRDEETRGTRRFKAIRQWHVGFGPAWSSGLKSPGSGTQWSLGYNWGLDPDYDLTLMWDFYVPKDDEHDDARFTDFSLGLNYYFSQAKHTAFVGADIGYGSAAASDGCGSNQIFCTITSDDEASGWVIGVRGGYKFFRTSTVNLGIVLRYAYMFDKTDLTNKAPSVTSVRLVVYY